MNFGERLKAIRLQKDLTQQQFADLLTNEEIGEIKQKTVSRWEKGERVPSVEVLLRISEVTDLTIDELIKGTVEGEIIELIDKKTPIELTGALLENSYSLDGKIITDHEAKEVIAYLRTRRSM